MFSAPRKASVLVTGRCNLSCGHCTTSSSGPLGDEISLLDWEVVFDRLAASRVLGVTVSGGEPLVRGDFILLIQALARRPLRINLNTNATLMGMAEAEALARIGPRLDSIMVSMDGSTREEHDSIRGTGAFESMLSGVENLARAGLAPGFCCTVTSLNAGSLDRLAAFALERGRWLAMNPFLRSGPCLPSDLALPPQEYRAACETALAISRRYPGRIRGSLPQMAAAAADFLAGRTSRRSGHGHSCGGGLSIMTVLPDGNVSPCDHFSSLSFGSLLDSDLETVLSSQAARAFRERVEIPLESTPSCSGCSYLEYCSGGCPVIPWSIPGPLGADPLSCLKAYFGD